MKVETYENGVPSWVALSTGDPAAAVKFYDDLLGWRDAGPSNGTTERVQLLRDMPAAAIGPRIGTLRPAWRVHIKVVDAEKTAEKVVDAGGRILRESATVGHEGAFAVLADTSGAELAVWQAGARQGAGVIHERGAFAWSELITDDVHVSSEFYGAVFGWTLTAPATGDASKRRVWQSRGRLIAGLLPRPAAMPKEIPAYWDVFFGVEDSAMTVEKVTGLGGRNLMPPIQTPHGRIAVFADPAGVVFSVLETPFSRAQTSH